ncbi:hypothetical protein [Arenimonas sp.]|uniref:hypothetical protein n=1 Tax=Arenimonas sp. TaxID=1872635 RepID=UPI002E343A22|nr:hypothetical protein [Arenimonas sp.]HEX4855077.1 hypothetical protein [Arenimonas sp.]
MSIDSALIVRRAALPTAAQLAADIAETGVIMAFPADFALDQNIEGWVPVSVDGQPSGFRYAVQSLAELDLAELPDGAAGAGDTLLAFGAQGALSAQTVTLVHEVMGRRYRAWLLIEDELLPPDESWGPGAPLDDLHVDRRGSPAKLAGDVEAYVAQHYPPAAPARRGAAREMLKQLIVPILVFVALGGFYLWSQLK